MQNLPLVVVADSSKVSLTTFFLLIVEAYYSYQLLQEFLIVVSKI